MTPQERQLIDDLFNRLARLEGQPRDPQAQQAIEDGLSRAPNALYPLVQTVLVQDEALKRAQARLAELGDGEPQQEPGFLDSMRNLLTGQPSRGTVPSVRPGYGGDPRAAAPNAAFGQGFGQGVGNSFLGTAAATAAGVVGGAMIGHMLGGLFGGSQARASAFDQPASSSPWDRGNQDSARDSSQDSSLARDAGVNDVNGSGDTRSAGLFDDSSSDDDGDGDFDFDGDLGGDFGDDAA
jgi:hypothetical protein